MSRDNDHVSTLRRLWGAEPGELGDLDYTLFAEIDGAYVARSRAGLPVLLIPCSDIGLEPVGRRASGCELVGHPSTRLIFQGRDKVGPVAALVCLDPALVDAFIVLALDVSKRVRKDGESWSNMIAAVEEWQTLLAPRGRLSAEAEAGLWGEMWFLSQADDVEKVLSGWRGPEGDATDFFFGGKGVEVKTSHHRRHHHVSLSQVDVPLGTHAAWLLSIWVKLDPRASTTIVDLGERILDRARDRGDALRRLIRAGYSPVERSCYTASFVILAEPEWYEAANVPRVRAADPGVSQLRYLVALDEASRADQPLSASLWQHFHGHEYIGGPR